MRRFLVVFGLVLGLAPLPALAACTGSVASGITLSQPTTYYLRNGAGCTAVGSFSAAISPSTLATVGTYSNQVTITPTANGTGTLSITAAGYTALSVPLTVSLGVLDLDTQ